MIAVLFEAIPNEGRVEEYLALASELKAELGAISGFISIERFQSLTDPDKILSLSYWKDEEAIHQWRNIELHRTAQAKGRGYIFKSYNLKIAGVTRDYGMADRHQAPADSKLNHH